MEYPDDVVEEARMASFMAVGSRAEEVLFRVVANMLMRERLRCAKIAREKFPHEGQAKMRRAGSMIADEILGIKP